MTTSELGAKGEQLAVDHLQQIGYTILERNYRWQRGEIDVICQRDQEIIFVEVKTRATNAFGEPYVSVTLSKQRQIIKVAGHYLSEYNVDLDARFDVISIVTNQHYTTIEQIPSAFYPL